MAEFTPINIYKLSKNGREFLERAKEMAKFNVEKIRVSPRDYSDLLDSISPASRSFYSDGIPFMGKTLVRK